MDLGKELERLAKLVGNRKVEAVAFFNNPDGSPSSIRWTPELAKEAKDKADAAKDAEDVPND